MALPYKLNDEYFAAAKRRALRFAGCLDAGTSGSLAADVLRLLGYIDGLKKDLQAMKLDTQAGILPPVAEAATDAHPSDWILRGDRELRAGREEPREPAPRMLGDGLTAAAESEAERLLRLAADTTRERRANYSPPREHFARTVGAINAIFAAKLREPFTAADWALIMILDKAARHQGDRKTNDTPVDIAGYAGCLAECEAGEP
jgi:outer membrane murein-binding lipoprotein Lpp